MHAIPPQPSAGPPGASGSAPSTRRNEPIATWREGDNVSGFALLIRREVRRDRNGKEYLDLELADSSGSILAKAWSDTPASRNAVDAQRFVAFKGSVRAFRESRQLHLEDCREATDDDRRFGFDEANLIPTTREDIDDLWRRLNGLLERRLSRPVLRRLALDTLAVHGPALREHPAAKTIHHAYRGGLLEHVVTMAELADRVCDNYTWLDRELILVGVLFHDLGKLLELGAMPANDYTREGRLVGHVVIGRDLLRERCAAIPDFPAAVRVHLEHLVLSHQGERAFGSPVEPMSAEALVLHFIDNLDSKLNQFRYAADSGAEFQYVRGVGRHIYVAAATDGGGEGTDGAGIAGIAASAVAGGVPRSEAEAEPAPAPETLSLFDSGASNDRVSS
jgi:3'-5' exoribonuclease